MVYWIWQYSSVAYSIYGATRLILSSYSCGSSWMLFYAGSPAISAQSKDYTTASCCNHYPHNRLLLHPPPIAMIEQTTILGTRIDACAWEPLLGRIMRWAREGQSRMLCLCNVHTLVTARYDQQLAGALQHADLRLPDGAPLAWLMRRRGWIEQQRISGPDLMWQVIREAEKQQLPVFLLGGTPAALSQLRRALMRAYPQLKLAGSHSPPFRMLSATEQRGIGAQINRSGARIVLVGLQAVHRHLG
ncbi:MAG: glycosyltransferase [Oxalobacteraceae bacterium]|nr:glycosyltransferase [Oxalobacteraceae bacterium]